MKITAKGQRNGKTLTVDAETVADTNIWRYRFNGKNDYELEAELDMVAEERHPIGGTYYPNPGSGLYVISALSWFFDKQPTFTTTEMDEEIPQEENGGIY